MLRPGLVSEAPAVRLDPVDVVVAEGHVAQFRVVATGLEPLRWAHGCAGRGGPSGSVGLWVCDALDSKGFDQ